MNIDWPVLHVSKDCCNKKYYKSICACQSEMQKSLAFCELLVNTKGYIFWAAILTIFCHNRIFWRFQRAKEITPAQGIESGSSNSKAAVLTTQPRPLLIETNKIEKSIYFVLIPIVTKNCRKPNMYSFVLLTLASHNWT